MEKWAWTWVVRRDGWMRRLPLALPLFSELKIHEPAENAICQRMLDAGEAPPENLNVRHRVFRLQKIKTTGENALPWAEPHYYQEI
ncbi:MAG: hypothetical protein JSU89_15445 [Myxococcales bacterium]|nr:MAG: hypothetical protein JSU89_15445 [Myxococcales bacterium]